MERDNTDEGAARPNLEANIARLVGFVHNASQEHGDVSAFALKPAIIDALLFLQESRAQLAEARTELVNGKHIYNQCRDLSSQGWSALNDARMFIQNLGTPDDLIEACQNIDLAQASFADTIIASELRALSAEAEVARLTSGLQDIANAKAHFIVGGSIGPLFTAGWNGAANAIADLARALCTPQASPEVGGVSAACTQATPADPEGENL